MMHAPFTYGLKCFGTRQQIHIFSSYLMTELHNWYGWFWADLKHGEYPYAIAYQHVYQFIGTMLPAYVTSFFFFWWGMMIILTEFSVLLSRFLIFMMSVIAWALKDISQMIQRQPDDRHWQTTAEVITMHWLLDIISCIMLTEWLMACFPVYTSAFLYLCIRLPAVSCLFYVHSIQSI